MKVKILFVICSLDLGGLEKVFLSLIKGLDRNKFDISIKLIYNYGRLIREIPEDIDVSYIFDAKYFVRGYTYFYKYGSMHKLVKRYIADEYDIIVAYGEGPATNLVYAYSGNAKTVSWLHGDYGKRGFINLYGKRKYGKIYAKFNRVFCVSEDTKKDLITAFPTLTNAITVYNPIESEKIIEMAQEKCLIDNITDVIKIVTVGRFAEVKANYRLINSAEQLLKEGISNFKIFFIGEGSLESTYAETIKKKNLGNHIEILGYKKNPFPYVRAADIYACASLFEGFSTAVTEAVILGKAIVVTDCGGMKEILGNDNQFGIVTENTDGAFYEGLKKIVTDTDLLTRYKQAATVRSKKFEYKNLIGATEDMLIAIVRDE